MYSKSYCFCSIDKSKSRFQIRNKFEHNMRLKQVDNADPAKRNLNEILVGTDDQMRLFEISKEEAIGLYKKKDITTFQSSIQETKDMVERESGRKVRSDAVLAEEVVLTYSSEEDVDIDRWKEKNVAWLNKQFGKENVLSAVLHMDETTPHIHAIILPIDRDRGVPSFNAKKWTGGAAKLIKMQDSYAKDMEEFGLERGERGSAASHEDLRRFHTALNNVVAKELPERKPDEPEPDYLNRLNEYYRDMMIRMFALEKSIERLEAVEKTRQKNENLYRKIAESRIAGYEEQINVLKSDMAENDKKAAFIDNIQEALNNLRESDQKKADKLKSEINDLSKQGAAIKRQKEQDEEFGER